MPKIVDSDTLNAGLSRSPIHFSVQVILRNGEYPFIRFNAIQAFESEEEFWAAIRAADEGK